MGKTQSKYYLENFEGEEDDKPIELDENTRESLGNAETELDAAVSAENVAKELKMAQDELKRAEDESSKKKKALDEEQKKASKQLADDPTTKKRYGTTLTEDDFKAVFEFTAEDVEKLRNDVTNAVVKNPFGGVHNYVNSRISTTERKVDLTNRFSVEIPTGASSMTEEAKNKALFNYHMSRELLKKTVENNTMINADKNNIKLMTARIIIEDAFTQGAVDALKNADPGDFGSQSDVDANTLKSIRTNAEDYEKKTKVFRGSFGNKCGGC